MQPVSVRNPKLCPVHPTNRVHFGEFITIRKNSIYISDSLWEKMEFPDYVQFAVDLNEKIFGFKKTDEKDIYAVKVKMNATGGARCQTVSNIIKTIVECAENPLDLDAYYLTCRHPSVVSGGYVVFSMKYADKNPIRKYNNKDK